MSVQTEIQRIKDNVTATLEAIADKSVTVPAESKSDDLAALISSIEGGGAPVVYGSVTLTSGAKNLTITHGLGVVPNFVAYVVLSKSMTTEMLTTMSRAWGWAVGSSHTVFRTLNGSLSVGTSTFDLTKTQTSSSTHSTAADSATATTIVLGNSAAVTANVGFASGRTVHYVVGVL